MDIPLSSLLVKTRSAVTSGGDRETLAFGYRVQQRYGEIPGVHEIIGTASYRLGYHAISLREFSQELRNDPDNRRIKEYLSSALPKDFPRHWADDPHLRERVFKLFDDMGQDELYSTSLPEWCALEGINLATNNAASVLHFTLHKAASTHVGKILRTMMKARGVIAVDYDGYFYTNPDPDLRTTYRFEERISELFRKQGHFYGPLREFIYGIEDIGAMKKILMVRDPRDILVSLYYSFRFSHSLPTSENEQARFARLRTRVSRRTVDEFVLQEADTLKSTFSRYIKNLLPLPNLLILKYEDLVENYVGWLSQILCFLDYAPESVPLEKLLAMATNIPKREDVASHLRKASPGDHREKLQPATIKILNNTFNEVFATFGYSL